MSFLNIGQKLEKVMGKEQELLEAARTGNVQVVEKLLSSRSRRSVGGSALTQLTSFLRSLNVNCADKNGYTALHHAAVNGHKDVVKLLVSEDAAADLADNQGCTPLHLAAWRGNGEICQLLLTSKTGANKVNVQNSSGDTALHMSAQYGYLAVVKVLVQHKANPMIRNLREESPLDLAAQYGKLEVVQELLESNPDLLHKAICNHSPIHLASRNGHRDVVDCLLKNGYSVNTVTDMGTGLHEAALHGKLEVVKLLLEKGVDVEAKDSNGRTVLDLISVHQSAEKSYTDIKEAIIDHMNKMQKLAQDEPPPPPPPTTSQETLTPTKPMPKPKPRQSLAGPKVTSPVTSPVVQTAPLLEEPHYAMVEKDRHHEEGTDRDQIKSSVSIDEPPPLPPRVITVVCTDSPPSPRRKNDSTGSPETIAVPPSFPPTEYLKMDGKTQSVFGELPPKSPETIQRTLTTIKKPPRTKRSPCPQRPSEAHKPTGPIMVDSTDAASTPTEENKYTEIGCVDENKYMEIPNIPEKSDKHSKPQKGDLVQQSGDLVKELKLLPSCFKNRALPPTPCKVQGKNENKQDNSITTVSTERLANEELDYIDMSPVSSTGSTPPVSVHSTPLTSANDDNYGLLFQKYKRENSTKSESSGTKRDQLSKETSVESDYVFPMEKPDSSSCSSGQDSLQNEVENLYETTWNVNMEGRQKRKEEEDITWKLEPDQDSLQKEVENLYETTWDMKREEKPKQEEEEVNAQQELDSDCSDTVSESASTNNSIAAEKPDSLHLNLARRSMKTQNIPITPTGYHQPPTPDFPPPSPTTAIQGIQQKIQQMDEKRTDKRKSCDMTTLTEDIPCVQVRDLKLQAGTQQDSGPDQTPASDMQENYTNPHFTEGQIKSIPVYSDSQKETVIKLDITQSIPGSSQNIPKSSDAVQSVMETVQGQEEVVMRRKSSQGSTSDVDLEVYAGLLKGSTPGGPRKVVSQIIDNVAYRHSTAAKRKSTPSNFMTFDPVMEKEEDIDPDKFMDDLDAITIAAKNSSGVKMKDDTSFEEDWDQIQEIMESFGSGLVRESVFMKDHEADFIKLLRGANAMQSVGEWLESIGLEKYENFLVANGFDDTDFLGANIMEDQDLQQIGVLSYEDRRKILEAAKSSPKLTPIDFANPPSSVEEWLSSIHLLDYCDKFHSHNYDTMDKVKCILWELELRTVLDITMLGHRKRILASLGNRQPPDRHGTLKKKSLNILAEENGDTGGKLQEISLFKDYTKVKPHSSSEDDLKDTSPRSLLMSQSSSEEEEVFRKEGKLIRDSTIHLRPPHMAQCKSPAKTWRHKPEVLIKGCCNYTAQYLGSTLVTELIGTESTRSGISKLKKSSDVISKVPSIMLSISFKGVKFIDAKSKHVICDHEIGNIFCACQDVESLNFFAYITRDVETANHYCHVFNVKSPSLAHDIILTLGEAFEVAYQMAMKEKSLEEAMVLDRKMSQSDPEPDTQSTSSKISTQTV
ncbi:hypothetical protein CHS0354_008182 [Potamilus streckersoni]|uniref:Ankyrin repeat and SAM domain-containing protein 1A-like n=1 Tax=Potamilus streckersoni TaxID=2493646 RepID=A0AAE0RWF0_9BIVA|nr:hypothetical protein CHS0354_008182 [Potamilus streckersoni]